MTLVWLSYPVMVLVGAPLYMCASVRRFSPPGKRAWRRLPTGGGWPV